MQRRLDNEQQNIYCHVLKGWPNKTQIQSVQTTSVGNCCKRWLGVVGIQSFCTNKGRIKKLKLLHH